jgi:hypothetical protein
MTIVWPTGLAFGQYWRAMVWLMTTVRLVSRSPKYLPETSGIRNTSK